MMRRGVTEAPALIMDRNQEYYLKTELYNRVQSDRTIFDFLQAGSLDGLWYWDIERPQEEWLSPRFKEVCGYADDEISNTSAWWQENIFPEDLPVVLENFRRHCADPAHPYDQTVRYRHKNGGTVWVRCRGIAIRDAHGRAIRMLGAHTDVTAIMAAHESQRQQAEARARAAQAQTERVLEGISDAFVALDRDWCLTYVNARAAEIFGRAANDFVGKSVWREFPESEVQFRPAFEQALKNQTAVELEEFYPPFGRWLEVRAHPTPDGLSVFFRDVSARKLARDLIAGQSQILEMVALGRPLSETLAALLRLIEGQSPDMLCSILLLDDSGQRVRHGAAPSLPEDFNRAIDGAAIGPIAGSCGTALYRREPVFVADIASDPLWADYMHLALPHGLRACWSTPIFDADGRALGTFAIYFRETGLPTARHRELIGFATHTSAICISRQRAESALRVSEARYALAVRGTNDGLWDWNIPTNADYLSPRWKELLGFADHELPNHADSFFQRIHPDDLVPAQEAVKAHLERRVPYNIELRLRTKSGEYRWFRSRGQAEWDESGRPLRMAGAISDVTDQRAAEQALRDSAEFNRQIIAGANEGVVVLDPDLRYTVWNPFMEELLGLRAAEVLGRHPTELFPWVREGGQLAAMQRALAGEIVVLPDSQRLKTGAKRISWVQARLSPLRNARDEIVGVIATISDVTERKQAEEELRRSHEQLRALAARLHSVREEQSAHIAREIHDVLGQQLTALKLDLAWLKRKAAAVDDEELRTVLAGKVVSTMALVDTTIKTVQKVATDLRPGLLDKLGLAAALKHEVSDFAERSGLRGEVAVEPEPITVTQARAIDVFRVCQEMLTNVARHARATEVKVRLFRADGQLVLEVSDNGCGISPQQLHDVKSLGLLGMKERAQLLGGRLDIRGAPGHGTCAVLTVPLA